MSEAHAFVSCKSFMAIVNYVFFSFDTDFDEEDETDLYCKLLDALIVSSYHEVAIQYEEFIEVIPLSCLPASKLLSILPPGEGLPPSSFWKKIAEISEEDEDIELFPSMEL
mmetsp:Transcript_28053/g.42406  ORF Transcript_28053/g.42406 Transcript_28053/m.42406 type:complete len:111 (-) Transcript_28053:712-1044(-)